MKPAIKPRKQHGPLVLDGNEVKLRLTAERTATKSLVHVDWVRFTVLRRNADAPAADLLFPQPVSASVWDEGYRQAKFAKLLAELQSFEFDASAQALQLARDVAEALGRDFTVACEVRKGQDFYRYRWAIERNGAECGWVGFLASGDSPRQQAQSRTIHCNLFGAACTFAATGWRDRLADMVEDLDATLTRVDLALDFFEGLGGGMARVLADYSDGLCNVGGKLPKCNMLGDWSGHSEGGRSFYIGSKEAGKQTNVYEKGDQLFGVGNGSPWMRAELRYGNKLRELSVQMLRRPADFFAGASDWHAVLMREAEAQFVPERAPCRPKLQDKTVEAAAARVARWARDTAAPTLSALLSFGGDALADLLFTTKLPGRLKGYSASEVRRAFAKVADKFSTTECDSPAFAMS